MSSEKKIPTYKPKPNLQIEVVFLEELTQKHRTSIAKPHRTDFYHIFLFGNCHPKHWVDFERIEVKPFSLLFIDQERVHQFDRHSGYEGHLLIFTEAFFCTTNADTKFLKRNILFNGLADQTLVALSENGFEKFSSICQNINDELKIQDGKSQHILLKNLLQNFLILAEREIRSQGHREQKKGADLDYTLLFRDLLEQHYSKFKAVSDYSGLIFISEKRLRQATSRILGKTPKEIINDRIILEVKRLLVHTTLSIKEIGQELGFDDPAYFVRFFRKNTETTPVKFRETFSKN